MARSPVRSAAGIASRIFCASSNSFRFEVAHRQAVASELDPLELGIAFDHQLVALGRLVEELGEVRRLFGSRFFSAASAAK